MSELLRIVRTLLGVTSNSPLSCEPARVRRINAALGKLKEAAR